MAKKDGGPAIEGADLITPTNGAVVEDKRIVLSPDQAQLICSTVPAVQGDSGAYTIRSGVCWTQWYGHRER